MRVNIVIEDSLMADARKVSGLKGNKEIIELGLKTLIRLKQQESIKAFRGKLIWGSDLDDQLFGVE